MNELKELVAKQREEQIRIDTQKGILEMEKQAEIDKIKEKGKTKVLKPTKKNVKKARFKLAKKLLSKKTVSKRILKKVKRPTLMLSEYKREPYRNRFFKEDWRKEMESEYDNLFFR